MLNSASSSRSGHTEAVSKPAASIDRGGDPPCWAHLALSPDEEVALSQNNHADQSERLTDAELSGLLEGLMEGVIVADSDGLIIFWNAGATKIFGWEAAEAIGKSLDLIIPTKQRPAHWDGYRAVMQTGQTRYEDQLLQVPALHRDGHRLSISFSVALVPSDDNGGGMKAIAAIVRDETARWNDERELRRQLAALGTDPQPS